MTVFADNFLAGALITLLIPGTVFVAVVAWYWRSIVKRNREDEHERTGAYASRAGAEEETSGAVG